MTDSPIQPAQIDPRLLRDIMGFAGTPKFRGGMFENCRTAPMGKGYSNNGQPFDPNTACYLKPIAECYDRDSSRKIVIKAGVKTMKSFFVEMALAHHIAHRIGDGTIYFGSGDMADDQSTSRILNYFWGIPSMAAKRRTIIGQWDETMGAVKFPDKTLRLKAANLTNTQDVNLCFVGIRDAFVTEKTGMIQQAIARTTQYPHDKKIIIESQGGEEGFDFDDQYDDTDQGELHVICPHCGSAHIWNWKAWDMIRDEHFVAVAPKTVPSLDREAWIQHWTPLLKGELRRRCGFKRGDDEFIKLPDGDYNESEVLRQTYFECYYCGQRWEDDGEFGATRIALDESSHYVPFRTTALPGYHGFNFPQWINRRLPWGQMMLDKLKEQRKADRLGNFEGIKQWWQKVAGRTWMKEITRRASELPAISSYDLSSKKLPGEKVRISGTDCQFNLTHMIYLAVAVGDGVPDRVLHYEWIKPPTGVTEHEQREFCKNRVRQLDKELGIQQQNSMKDAGHRADLVREWAAEDAIYVRMPTPRGVVRQWVTYGLLIGDEKMSYRWQHPGRKPTWERFKPYEYVNMRRVRNGKVENIPVHHRLWSNWSIKEIAERWRDGNSAPKLQIHPKFHDDTSKEGLWAQLTSERKLPWKGRPGKERYDNEGRPNHAWDAYCMINVRKDELGMFSQFSAPEADPD